MALTPEQKREKARIKMARWRALNPEKVKAHNERERLRRAALPKVPRTPRQRSRAAENMRNYRAKLARLRAGEELPPEDCITPEERATWAAYMREWVARNSEQQKARKNARFAERYANDPAYRAAHNKAGRASYRRRKEHVYRRQVQYETAEHPLSRTVRAANYRAKKRGVPGKLVLAEVEALVARHGDYCEYCGHRPAFSLDHVVPMCEGGPNTLDNVTLCCGWCNSSKRHRTAAGFRPPAHRLADRDPR